MLKTQTNPSTLHEDWARRGADNPVRKQMLLVKESAEAVAAGHYHGLVVSGPPGVGKNHVVTSVFEAASYVIDPVKPVAKKRTVTTVCPNSNLGLLDVLYEAGEGVLLFDEADKVWGAGTINTLKKALDTNPRNRVVVNNVKGKRKVDDEKGHLDGQPFLVRARCVFLTNKNLGDLAQWPKSVHQHIPAIQSRIPTITISDNLIEIWEYTCYLTICEGYLQRKKFSLVTANAALAYMTETMFRAGEASPRRLEQIAKEIAIHPNTWRAHLDNRLPPRSTWLNGTPPPAPVIVPRQRGAATTVIDMASVSTTLLHKSA